MPFFLLAGAGLLSAGIGAAGASSAANTEANAANNSTAAQLKMYNDTVAREQPFVTAGTTALSGLEAGVGINNGSWTGYGPLNKPFSLSDFQQSPGYNFQLQQGENAVLNNASATGGIGGGNTLKALTTFGQGVANQDYWNAYNAYTAQQNQTFGQLQTLAGSGQNAAANLGALGTQVGSSVGNNIIGAGNASAAGTVGITNALTGGIGGIGQNYLLAQLLQGGGGGLGVDNGSLAGILSGSGG